MQHPQLGLWNFLLTNIDANINCILLYVVESNGSSPGRQGFAMVVNANNKMVGSIGGGIMEFKLVEYAKQKITDNNLSVEIKQQIHNKEVSKNQSGMICSGEQTIAFIPVDDRNKQTIEHIIDSLKHNSNNTLLLNNQGISLLENHNTFNYIFNKDNYGNWLYKEKIGYKNKLTIIGAGHCALALSKLMCTMDFYVELFDDRDNLNTFNDNDFVHQKTIIDDYKKISNHIIHSENHFVVVMTVGYRTDAIIVKALQDKQFSYLGVLGSKNKMKQLFAEFEQTGVSKNWLNSIHTPIGLDIKSKTPEEIAISIAAEIIATKNSNS